MRSRHERFNDRSGPELFARLRQKMVDEQIRAQGILDPRVQAAMLQVPREEFAPAAMRESAYDDAPCQSAYMCGAARRGGGQNMYRITKRDGSLSMDDLGAFVFVPLIGGQSEE